MLRDHDRRHLFRSSRRTIVCGFASLVVAPSASMGVGAEFDFGITPVFLDNKMELLSVLQRYLAEQLNQQVRFIKQRTYRETLVNLLSGRLDAAWISDFLYVQFQDRLALVAVPLYRHQPFRQGFVIVNEASKASTFDDIRGTVHAFSDPDSTSGYLITRWLLTLRQSRPSEFFRGFFFTYSHRNVLRAVANGLAESGSIEGYIWEVLKKQEPELADRTRIVFRSEWLGFPPIVALGTSRDLPNIKALKAALIGMTSDRLGREVLSSLALDGFTAASSALYETTAEKWRLVEGQV
jgi:phosphonate transport system substrate-binding protein